MKTCIRCGHIFKRNAELEAESPCPILDCYGEVVEIDDNILHTIQVLNQKGYSTSSSCSGHTWGDNPYITFAEIVNPKSFASLPKKFSSSVFDGCLNIGRFIKPKNQLDRQKEIMEANVELIKWAGQLPEALWLSAEFMIGSDIDRPELLEDVSGDRKLRIMDVEDLDEDTVLYAFEGMIDPRAGEKLRQRFSLLQINMAFAYLLQF